MSLPNQPNTAPVLDFLSVCEGELPFLGSEQVDGRRVIRGRLSRTELAKRVGASREMVSRILVEMQTHGLYETDAQGHLVLNMVLGDARVNQPVPTCQAG